MKYPLLCKLIPPKTIRNSNHEIVFVQVTIKKYKVNNYKDVLRLIKNEKTREVIKDEIEKYVNGIFYDELKLSIGLIMGRSALEQSYKMLVDKLLESDFNFDKPDYILRNQLKDFFVKNNKELRIMLFKFYDKQRAAKKFCDRF